MASWNANPVASPGRMPLVSAVGGQIKHIDSLNFSPRCKRSHRLDRTQAISLSNKRKSTSVTCAAALNARCSAEQTQTVTRQSSTITVAPIQGKEKSPDLDDGGDGFPPRDDGDGGGGGGGGGGWSGGFFFFGFLAFLGLLRDQESESPYKD
ncbi:protein YELLOW LEAF 1, choloroplastic-like [Heracleum sosnowskyi]|uniref:Protein YELLOW LEAF 1, choloroplastic-like n=1 Tax=Heracleum sosnowskyi TaxID=360622 RepID=A0AAD8GWP9_9APIA|nr:protein YELLOW LEAF 1, choloroplastic-like [Heracleum sosnowskyi]